MKMSEMMAMPTKHQTSHTRYTKPIKPLLSREVPGMISQLELLKILNLRHAPLVAVVLLDETAGERLTIGVGHVLLVASVLVRVGLIVGVLGSEGAHGNLRVKN